MQLAISKNLNLKLLLVSFPFPLRVNTLKAECNADSFIFMWKIFSSRPRFFSQIMSAIFISLLRKYYSVNRKIDAYNFT
jgi:hypothetical protein